MPTATTHLDSPQPHTKGDMDGDGDVDSFDVDDYNTALADLVSYYASHPTQAQCSSDKKKTQSQDKAKSLYLRVSQGLEKRNFDERQSLKSRRRSWIHDIINMDW